MLVMDVDGTLTDGKLYISANGEAYKVFSVKDGYGIEMLHENMVTPVIITGRESQIVLNRANELGIERVYQGIKNKAVLLNEIAVKDNISFDEIAYIGDDNNDIECMKLCGLSGCPTDAASEVKAVCVFVSKMPGGAGAVREFAEEVVRRNSLS
jgi:3-deoxy-D-manno-octulosonate 8-phosphate phosphatase (KDO 8-P phosphatase)